MLRSEGFKNVLKYRYTNSWSVKSQDCIPSQCYSTNEINFEDLDGCSDCEHRGGLEHLFQPLPLVIIPIHLIVT